MRRPALHLLTALMLLAHLLAAPWLAVARHHAGPVSTGHAFVQSPPDLASASVAAPHCPGHATPALPAPDDHHRPSCCDQPDEGCSCGCAVPTALRLVELPLPAWSPVVFRAAPSSTDGVLHSSTPPFRPPADLRVLS